MAEDDQSGKTIDPTAERLRKARQKGNVPQSPELQTLARFTGVFVGIVLLSGAAGLSMARSLVPYFDRPLGVTMWLFTDGTVLEVGGPSFLFFLSMVGFAGLGVIAIVVAMQSMTFSPSKLKPDLSKISPLKNAGNKFGPVGLADFAKSAVKMAVIMVAATFVAIGIVPGAIAGLGAPAAMLFGEMRSIVLVMLGVAIGLAAVASAIDVPLRWGQHRKKLRMSHQDVKDEAKENEGDPTQKQARQKAARDIASGQGLKDVPQADVVVVNPEHYAVALRWDREAGEVPRCVAKGVDHLALRIRSIADEAGVPVHRDVPTARSLYATVEIGDEIRREHFEAVAAAIRFADGLQRPQRR